MHPGMGKGAFEKRDTGVFSDRENREREGDDRIRFIYCLSIMPWNGGDYI